MLILKTKSTGNSLPLQKISSSEYLIDTLTHISESRIHAISAYKHAPGATEKLQTIEYIRYELKVAKQCFNPTDAIKICLRLEHKFRSLTPSTTSKLHRSFTAKVDAAFNECRIYLERRKQC